MRDSRLNKEARETSRSHVPFEIVALLALVGYAIYRQARQHEVVGGSRYKLAIIYASAGVLIGRFALPPRCWC